MLRRGSLSLGVVSAALVLLNLPALARTSPGSGFFGSVHDFSRRLHPNGKPAADACVSCHIDSLASNAPPGAQDLRLPLSADGRYSPALWDQELAGTRTAYTMYQSGPGAPTRGHRASQAVANGMTPGSTSLLCLSCHDSSVAINSYGNRIGNNGYLGNHHPIGFDYEAVRAQDREIRFADAAMLGAAGVVRDHLYGPGNARMECGTCHSVHNTGNTGETLLWRSDARSHLCLTCHDKGTDPGMATP